MQLHVHGFAEVDEWGHEQVLLGALLEALERLPAHPIRFMDPMERGSGLYNVPCAVRLKGEMKEEAMRRALSEIVRRHEVMRTVFREERGEAVQVVEEAKELEMEGLRFRVLRCRTTGGVRPRRLSLSRSRPRQGRVRSGPALLLHQARIRTRG